jgi:hypothetical protein
MKRTTVVLIVAAVAVPWAWLAAQEASKGGPAEGKAPIPAERRVDLCICLDTSNSMDSLIESAKAKLWAIVNELAAAKPRPVLRVALYQYGNDRLQSENGWVQRVCDLTDDLDTVYGKLFGLRTQGGTEYVARVVRSAAGELKWDAGKDTLKMIFVAGNEPATQDTQFGLQDICKEAISKGIIVNTIFCGTEEEGRRTGWSDAAQWADGRYASIDQDRGTVAVATPYDQKLSELGASLNKTYVAYGVGGAAGAANQAGQDLNAAASAPAAAERAVGKSTGLYRNASWDLVDAVKQQNKDIASLKEEELSEEMRKMTPEQRKAYVEEQAKKRADVQTEIQKLAAQRDAYIKDEMSKKGLSDKQAFDAALRAAVREQAQKKGFEFPATAPAK